MNLRNHNHWRILLPWINSWCGFRALLSNFPLRYLQEVSWWDSKPGVMVTGSFGHAPTTATTNHHNNFFIIMNYLKISIQQLKKIKWSKQNRKQNTNKGKIKNAIFKPLFKKKLIYPIHIASIGLRSTIEKS